MPINYTNTSNALFFIFQPTTGIPRDEVTIFLNGGPGWSSFKSFLQETGRFTWHPGTYRPVENPYAWTNETNMLWVDQPIGAGYSVGTSTAVSEEETAIDFVHFFKNFETLFGIKKTRSTSLANPMLVVTFLTLPPPCSTNRTPTTSTFKELSTTPALATGTGLNKKSPLSPSPAETTTSWASTRHSSPTSKNNTRNAATPNTSKHTSPTHLPPSLQPPAFFNSSDPASKDCAIWEALDHSVFSINACFNVYAVNEGCPLLWDVLGHRTQFDYIDVGAQVYPNRTDVKKAMHAPDIQWYLDQNHVPVFTAQDGKGGPQMTGDLSADPAQYMLPKVIEATERVLISNGDLDMVILTEGTLLLIQNMTWNGKLGFQKEPKELMIVDIPDLQYKQWFDAGPQHWRDEPQGVVGVKHFERGLMWAQTYLGTHVQPESQPRASLRHLQWVLGRREDL